MRFITSCLLLASTVAAENPAKIEDFGWIAGQWSGTVGRAKAEETWTTPAGGAMLGIGRVLAGERMVQFEFPRIEKRDSGIHLVAQPFGQPPTDFKLTRRTATLAVFENPKNDHPKIITYELTAPGALVATIEGDEGGKHKKAAYSFQRVAK